MFQHFLLQLHILCNFSFGILCAAVAFPSIVFAMNPLYLCVCLLATFTVRTQYSLFIVKINGTAYKIDKTYCVVSWIVCTKHIEHWTVRKRLMPICLINNNKNLFFFSFLFRHDEISIIYLVLSVACVWIKCKCTSYVHTFSHSNCAMWPTASTKNPKFIEYENIYIWFIKQIH